MGIFQGNKKKKKGKGSKVSNKAIFFFNNNHLPLDFLKILALGLYAVILKSNRNRRNR